MKKGLFTGWKDVFSFTFKQSANAKFKKTTILVAALLAVGMAAISIIMAFVEKKDDSYVSPIETVYVVNDSELVGLDFSIFGTDREQVYPQVDFKISEKSFEDTVKDLSGSIANDVILHIEEVGAANDVRYALQVVIPDGSSVSESDGEMLGDDLFMIMQQSKLISSGIPVEKLAIALSAVGVNEMIAGEEGKSIGEEMVQMLLPMLLMFFMYMMVLIYGMSIGNAVSVEKSSKLMEMILTLTKPYGLILGKVLALCSTAIIQIFVWIGSAVAGFFIGDYVAETYIYPGYVNYLTDVFKLLQGQDGSAAFSIPAAVLGLVALICGFVLYSSVAALVASFASKAEELANVMAYYQILMVAGFFASYLLPLQETEWINAILRLIPFTAAFILPGDIIVGRVTLLQGGLYGALLLIFVLVMSLLAGMVYRNQIFNRGKSIKDFFAKKNKKISE